PDECGHPSALTPQAPADTADRGLRQAGVLGDLTSGRIRMGGDVVGDPDAVTAALLTSARCDCSRSRGALVDVVGGTVRRAIRRCDQEIPLIACAVRCGLVGATRRGLARTIRRGLVDEVARVIGALRQRAEIGLRLL